MKKNSRRGFTVAEVVIALTVIVIVSGASMSLVAMQANNEAKAVATIEATNIAENAIECFRYAQNTGADFEDVFNYPEEMPDLEGTGPYTVTKDGVTVNIEIVDNTITISAKNAKDETILGTTTYTK